MKGKKEMEISRAKFWDEKTDSEKIAQLAHAVETLGRTCMGLEKYVHLLKQHQHLPSGVVAFPIQLSDVETAWYMKHLLGRNPQGEERA